MSLAEVGPRGSFRSRIEPDVLLLLSRVSTVLTEQGIETYIVGGLVRDMVLGRGIVDIDLAVGSDALEVAAMVATALGGKYVLLDKENGVGRVVLTGSEALSSKVPGVLDFSPFEDSIEQDLARRDFTIDAMAIELGQMVTHPDLRLPTISKKAGSVPPRPSAVIDPFGGWGDLHRGVIRAVSETVFASDAVRLLRAVRLAAELGFTIERKTESLIRRYAPLIAGVAGERVREELLRLLAIAGGQLLDYLDESSLLTGVFPELVATRGVEQPKEHCWDVFEHSLKTVSAVDFLLRQGDWEYGGGEVLAAVPWSAVMAEHFDQEVSRGSHRRALLKLAALLHDVAKPQAKAFDAGGRMRFLGHAQEGATMVADMLTRLRFSVREVKLVAALVRHHLRPTQMSQAELPTRRAIYRFFRDTEEAGIDILFLSLADHLATRGPNLNLAHWREHARVVGYVLTQRFQEESIAHPPKLIDGHDIINLSGLNPGPKIGEILEVVREAQASGEVATRPEALSLIKRLLNSNHSLKVEKR